jgi:hypothetical protein
MDKLLPIVLKLALVQVIGLTALFWYFSSLS